MSLDLIKLTNKHNLQACFISYGARWTNMLVPDKNGKYNDVILGFDTLSGYEEAGEMYHGATVGRVCGRISNSSFRLNGKIYNLSSNDVYGKPKHNHLHGGMSGFHVKRWFPIAFKTKEHEEAVSFYYTSKDGEEGYPGNLLVKVTYILTDSDILRMIYEAKSDQDTIVNMTNHAFFNLSGEPCSSILEHKLQLNASAIIECDRELIPTGSLLSSDNSPVFFEQESFIKDAICQSHSQVIKDIGFSIAYMLKERNVLLHKAACLSDSKSGRSLEIYTTQPSIQVYTAYFMDGKDIGKNGIPYYSGAGVALEPQGFPDAVHHPNFPSIVLKAGETYRVVSEYRFKY